MCNDPRTHDTVRTAAALVHAFVTGDTSAVDQLLDSNDDDPRYVVDVSEHLARMAAMVALRLGHGPVLQAAKLVIVTAGAELDLTDQFIRDTRECVTATAEYIATALRAHGGQEGAEKITTGFIRDLVDNCDGAA